MKDAKIRKKFLEELSRAPIVQHACERIGISRQTYYRWKEEDEEFATKANEALDMGVDFVNDHAESNILGGIKKGDMNASKWWLSARHKAYRRPFPRIIIDQSFLDDQIEKRLAQEAEHEVDEWIKQWEAMGIPDGNRKYTPEEAESMRLLREKLDKKS